MDSSTSHPHPPPEASSSQENIYRPQNYYPWVPHPTYMSYWQHSGSAQPPSGSSALPPHGYDGSIAPYTPYHIFSSYGSTSQPSSTALSNQGTEYRPPLINSISSITNNTPSTSYSSPTAIPPSTQPSKKRRRTAADTSASSTSKKRAATSTRPDGNTENIPPVLGAGPQSTPHANTTSIPTHSATAQASMRVNPPILFESVIPRNTNVSGADASDVWYFVRGLIAEEKPAVAPIAEPVSRKQPDRKMYNFLLCRLCGFDIWHTWKNSDGQTTTIRQHLLKHHQLSWEDMVIKEQLKNWQTVEQGRLDALRKGIKIIKEPFTSDVFYERLVRWVATDDQSVNILENPEFRHFILFACPYITDAELPHRTRLSKLIELQFEKEYQLMRIDIKNALGRVSFTSDVWSRQTMQSFMGVTAHFIAKSPLNVLTMETRLVAFRVLHGSHTGINLANEFLKVIEEIECLNKMSMVTLDNASNNQRMMHELEIELSNKHIPFSKEQNRVRCFPHVINIAVKAGLACLTILPSESSDALAHDSEFLQGVADPDLRGRDFFDDPPDNSVLLTNAEYCDALRRDVLGKIRRCVVALRSSGQRREQFHDIRQAGNAAGGWGDDGRIIRDIGPLNEVETRWSSSFFMVDRFIEIYPVIEKLIAENDDLADYAFSPAELRVASDIRSFLLIFHRVQQCVSAEKTPTLSIVLPLYEKVIIMLKNLIRKLPEIAHAIKESIKKLESYLAISRKTKIYALAMVLNPSIKYEWMKKNWSDAEYTEAKSSIFNLLLEFEKADRNVTPVFSYTTPTRTIVKAATVPSLEINQDSAYDELDRIEHDLAQVTRSQSMPNIVNGVDNQGPGPIDDAAELARRADENGKQRVLDEIKRYKDDGTLKTSNMHNLLQFWQVHISFLFDFLKNAAANVFPTG
ncbi:hypothetical protein D9619_008318 [Psilocybe cf. subviscida]|uniref:BED-type domain-containing protein n=1 Tax=Psilocybe cf. subviscida TaxID=2480587 RepID=A0A8H5BAI6_9AGAR|nr:hypothetical protein D9619_008318 [Psilocybe cf. subviscida]